MEKAFILGVVIATLFVRPLYADSLKSLEAIASKATSLSSFLDNPQLQNEYLKALRTYYKQDRFHCQSFSQVIDDLKRLVRKYPGLDSRLWAKKQKQDNLLVLSADGDVFQFRSPVRRFHAIWSYDTQGSCEDEVCESLFKDNGEKAAVRIGRWAVGLRGSQVHLVEKNGGYSGMALLVSSNQSSDGMIGTVDAFGNRESLTAKVALRSSVLDEPKKASLLDLWFGKLNETRPPWIKRFSLAQSGDLQYKPLDSLSYGLAKDRVRHCKLDKVQLSRIVPTTTSGGLPSGISVDPELASAFSGGLDFSDLSDLNGQSPFLATNDLFEQGGEPALELTNLKPNEAGNPTADPLKQGVDPIDYASFLPKFSRAPLSPFVPTSLSSLPQGNALKSASPSNSGAPVRGISNPQPIERVPAAVGPNSSNLDSNPLSDLLPNPSSGRGDSPSPSDRNVADNDPQDRDGQGRDPGPSIKRMRDKIADSLEQGQPVDKNLLKRFFRRVAEDGNPTQKTDAKQLISKVHFSPENTGSVIKLLEESFGGSRATGDLQKQLSFQIHQDSEVCAGQDHDKAEAKP